MSESLIVPMLLENADSTQILLRVKMEIPNLYTMVLLSSHPHPTKYRSSVRDQEWWYT